MIAAADAIFVFDRFNLRNLRRHRVDSRRVYWLGDFDPGWTGKRAIADPWGKSISEYHSTFERIERCVAELARLLPETDRRS